MGWAGHVACMDEECIQDFGGKTRKKETTRHRWKDNIMMDLGEMKCCNMAWIDLAQDRDQWRAHVNTVMNLRATKKCSKILE
jgi:hypothetical protein